MKLSISYCIPVHNESAELELLLKTLIPFVEDCDEIIVQGDQGKVTDAVISIIREYSKMPNFHYIEYPLNKDFGTFKSNFAKQCKSDYIFLIDADEIPSKQLLTVLKFLLLENADVDAYDVPRFNIVKGLTKEWTTTWGWNVTTEMIQKLDYDTKSVLKLYGLKSDKVHLVNLPDYQRRIYRKSDTIKWEGAVHEKLLGMNNLAKLPFTDFGYGIFHVKELQRQIKQNKFYEIF